MAALRSPAAFATEPDDGAERARPSASSAPKAAVLHSAAASSTATGDGTAYGDADDGMRAAAPANRPLLPVAAQYSAAASSTATGNSTAYGDADGATRAADPAGCPLVVLWVARRTRGELGPSPLWTLSPAAGVCGGPGSGVVEEKAALRGKPSRRLDEVGDIAAVPAPASSFVELDVARAANDAPSTVVGGKAAAQRGAATFRKSEVYGAASSPPAVAAAGKYDPRRKATPRRSPASADASGLIRTKSNITVMAMVAKIA